MHTSLHPRGSNKLVVSNEPCLSIENLTVCYHTMDGVLKATDNASLEINEGEIVGLVGESGCGKSTLALSITRLVPTPGRIISGAVYFKSTNLLTLSEDELRKIKGREITYVFQDPITYFNPIMKIKDQISEIITQHEKIDNTTLYDRLINLIKDVGIGDPASVLESYSFQLSGGMLQRCMIAMSIASSPKLIIFDEATTSLDVTTQDRILRLVKKLQSNSNMASLFVTHDLGIVAKLCDKVYIMYCGTIVEYADVFSLFERPMHPYTQGLLSCVFSIDEFKEKFTTIEGDVPNMLNPPKGCNFHPRCSKRLSICHRKKPPEQHSENGRMVSCWLYEKETHNRNGSIS